MTPTNSNPPAVFIRLDKIGDLVSTLPVDQLVGSKYNIVWMISKGLGFVAQSSVPPRQFIELDKSKPWNSFWILFEFLKETRPELAVSFQGPWWVSFALWIARVPKRVGRFSQWHSFLFFNSGLRQKRSLSEKHEADYNADLVNQALEQSSQPAPILKLQAPPISRLLSEHRLEKKNYFVVHPGMAGSALNWPIPNYIQLIRELLEKGEIVAVTGTAGDEPWLSEIKSLFRDHLGFRNLQNQLSSLQLLEVLAEAAAVFAPSTGVLHLAASLGTPVVGIFSPVKSQSSVRWKARGPKVKILEGEFSCPHPQQCQKENCTYPHALGNISVEAVLKILNPSPQ